jgi:hypothetical protein
VNTAVRVREYILESDSKSTGRTTDSRSPARPTDDSGASDEQDDSRAGGDRSGQDGGAVKSSDQNTVCQDIAQRIARLRPGTTLDHEGISQARREYHAGVEADPSDFVARMGLAWCLVCEALCEFRLEGSMHVAAPSDPSTIPQRPLNTNAGSTELIRLAVRQAATTKRLALDPQIIADAERLEAIVLRIGFGDILRDAENATIAQTNALLQRVLRSRDTGDN